MKLRVNEYFLGVVIGLAICASIILDARHFPKGLPIDQKWIDLVYVTIYLGGSLASYNWRFHKSAKFWLVLVTYCFVHVLISALYFWDHDGWPIRLWVPPLIVESVGFIYLWQCVLQKTYKPRRFL